MKEEPRDIVLERREHSLSIQIFSVSAALVGVCLTTIGIINLVTSYRQAGSWADEITAIDAVFFLCACLISYTAIRTKDPAKRAHREKIADAFFLSGLFIMAGVSVFIVYALI